MLPDPSPYETPPPDSLCQTAGPATPGTELVPASNTQLTTQPEESESEKPGEIRRSRSKIARLPRATRERLNQLLGDGYSYPDVIERLGEEAKNLNTMDLSRWMHSGHKLWLKQETWLEHVNSSFERAKDLVSENKAFSLHEANLHIAAAAMNETMLGCDMEALPDLLKEKPQALFTLLAAIPRFAREALNFQKYREACAQARVELQKLRDPTRTLSDDERRAIVDKVDEILGLK
jgi:hypothetical protein